MKLKHCIRAIGKEKRYSKYNQMNLFWQPVVVITGMYISAFRADELTCGGMAHQVRDAFAETMTSVVQLAARYPIACCNSIGLLCIIPYTRLESILLKISPCCT